MKVNILKGKKVKDHVAHGIRVEDKYVDATVKSKLAKSKKICTSIFYPHQVK